MVVPHQVEVLPKLCELERLFKILQDVLGQDSLFCFHCSVSVNLFRW